MRVVFVEIHILQLTKDDGIVEGNLDIRFDLVSVRRFGQ